MGKKSWKSWKEDNSRSKISQLENWKKEKGHVTVWLHTKSGIYQKGQHVVPYVKYDKEKKRDVIGFFFFNCHEDYETIRYKQEPEYCPMELFMQWLEAQTDIDDDDLVWECEVGKTNRSMTKYDIIENWQTKFTAKLKSMLPVIDDDNPTEVLVTEETISVELGIFKAIGIYEKELLEYGEDIDMADPDVNPYPFKWEFNAKASKPDEYYNVVALPRKKPSDKITELLNGPEVDLSTYIKPGDSKRLRQIMEDHIVLEGVPFDEIFGSAKDRENDTTFNYGDNKVEDIEEKEKVKETPKETKEKAPSVPKCTECNKELPLDDDGNPEECECQFEEVFECDVCGAEVAESDEECANCKRIEEEKKKKEEEKKKPPAKRRRRPKKQ